LRSTVRLRRLLERKKIARIDPALRIRSSTSSNCDPTMPDTLRVAIIGRTGRGDYGHGLDTVWASVPDAQVIAVADDDREGLAKAATRLTVERGYSDYRQMLDEAKPDIAAIAPRFIDQHRDMAVAAAERGIHIFMEKPFCRTLAEADEIVAACERTHTRLVMAHQTRYSPKLEVIRRLVSEGAIGRVLEYRGRGKEDSRGGSQDMFVCGWHIMDLIRFFAGHPKWCFASILEGDRPIRRGDVKDGPEGLGPLAGDSLNAAFSMADGTMAYFNSRRNAGQAARFALVICGTGGMIELQTGYLPSVKLLVDPKWSPGRSGATWQDVSSAGVGVPEPLMDEGLHGGNVGAAQDLIGAIRESRETKSNVYDGRGSLEMIMATFESQRVAAPVSLPLVNREHPLAMLPV
jgi:predicted dehydrogenase